MGRVARVIGAFIVAFVLSALASVAIRIALVKRVDSRFPLLTLLAGDQSVALSGSVLEQAARSEDRVTVALYRSYRASRLLVIVIFVVICAAVATRNLT